ncbi:uncharacterized protein [Lepeophtheirus salmonis]|uniref:uncharacterized protein n=1 Tax=Lepeophtheirus salmonis TaxID=72036 RepID=UPI001AE62941|nr:ATPase family AAA domain-containing protein FIGL1-like [Lepeophtheirus salmonis]
MHKYFDLESENKNLSSDFPTISPSSKIPKEYANLLPEYLSVDENHSELISDLIVPTDIDNDELKKINDYLEKFESVSENFFDDNNSNSIQNKETTNEDKYEFKKYKSVNSSHNANFTKLSGNNVNANEKENSSNSVIDRILKKRPEFINISTNIIEPTMKTTLSEIAGLEDVKRQLLEIIIWPLKNPELFTGLRNPPNGILLFGPPGTGKTLLGKAISSETNSTFFSISASSILSKFIGENEKAEPVIIFIDEVDSLLQSRSDSEHESSRRLKTEFLVQLDGINKNSGKVLVMAATNRPEEIDDAARRRFVKRLYVPLPCFDGRMFLIQNLTNKIENSLISDDYKYIADNTDGYSCSDVYNLVRDAVMGPVRDVINNNEKSTNIILRKVGLEDFKSSLRQIKTSVDSNCIKKYEEWNYKFGSIN